MSGFNNSIVGGMSKLIRKAIESPNYVPATAGWTVNQDGSAEFNNLNIRGTVNGNQYIQNANGFFVYSGTPAFGNLVASITSTASSGFDPFNNTTYPGFVVYVNAGGHYTQVGQLSAASMNFLLPGSPGYYAQEFVNNIVSAGTSYNSFGFATGDGVTGDLAGFDLVAKLQPLMVMRLGTRLVACDPSTTPGVNSTAEDWHAMSLTSGWGGTNTNYKLRPDGQVSFQGVITLPASGSYNSVTFATVQLPYYNPNHSCRGAISYLGNYPATYTAIVGSPRLFVSTAGGLQLAGIPSGENGQQVDISCTIDVT